MEHLRKIYGHAELCADRIHRTLQRLGAWARQWWQWHWTRIAEEHGYAEALTAVLVEAVELLSTSLRVRYLAHELLAVYVAILRTLRRSNIGEEPV